MSQNFKVVALLFFWVLFFLACRPLALNAGQAVDERDPVVFSAGAAASNITPHLGTSMSGSMQDDAAIHVQDELYARALVLDDGLNRLLLVLVDNCMVPSPIFDQAKAEIHRQTGIPPEHMLMSATHTHSGPTVAHVFQSRPDSAYSQFLSLRIVDAALLAINHLEPARVAWGSGEVAGHVFNRRWFVRSEEHRVNPFGGVDQVRMNPPRIADELIRVAGPVDPELFIVSVKALDGRPIALYANYSLHYVGGVPRGHLSSDYFGAFARIIEKEIGSTSPRYSADRNFPPFIAMLSNGASGDVNNIDVSSPPVSRAPFEQIDRVSRDVAREAVRVYRNLEYHDHVWLRAETALVDADVRLPDTQRVQWAQKVVKEAEGPFMRSREEIYARETLYLKRFAPSVSLNLQALRIGELAILAIPCEVFAQIGLELKQKSPFDDVFVVTLANGYKGYLPAESDFELGGYETWPAKSSYLHPATDAKVIDALLDLQNTLQLY